MKTLSKAFFSKLTLALSLLVGMATTAWADAKLSIADFTVVQGKTTEVAVQLANGETNITDLQFDLVLPAGMLFDEESIVKNSSRLPRKIQLASAKQNATTVRFVLASSDRTAIQGTSGTLFTFNVSAGNLPEDAVITIANIVCTDATGKVVASPAPAATKVGFEKASGDAVFVADNAELSIKPGETKTFGISLENDADGNCAEVVSLQGTIQLPAGLSLVKDEEGEYFSYADRIPGNAVFSFPEQMEGLSTVSFTLSSITNTKLLGNTGTLFYVNIKADENIALESNIVLKDFVLGSPNATAFKLKDNVVTVKVLDATEYAVTASVAPEETGTVEGAGAVAKSKSITLSAKPATGYQFVNWTVKGREEAAATTAEYTFIPTADVELVANFKPLQFVVKFIADGIVVSEQTLDYGAPIEAPEAPVKEGCTFQTWGAAETVPAEDVTYTATYMVNKYKVTFKIDDEVISEESYEFGAAIVVPELPAKEGYSTTGWGEVAETVPAEDVTYTATYTVNKYKVTFIADEKVVSEESLDFGAAITAPEAPAKEGYSFQTWGEVAETVPAKDVTYTATYVINQYKVTFIADEKVVSEQSLDFGAEIEVPELPTKEGYSTTGWGEVAKTVPAEDVTYTATYTVNKYKVAFIADGKVVSEETLEYGAAIVVPELPAKEGYSTTGWGEVVETVPAEDLTYMAIYTINQYKVKFIADEKVISEQTLDFGAAIVVPEAPAKEGYTFKTWGEVAETVPAKDVTYTASYDINQYKVKFVVEGETVKEETLAYGAAITAPAIPNKQGYEFSGWDNPVGTVPAADITFTGSFVVNAYKVTFTVDGAVYNEIKVEFGKAIVVPDSPTKEGHTFSGWSEIPATMPANDITITGKLNINQYTVKFIVDEKVVKEEKLDFGAAIAAPADPSKEGAAFTGWSPAVDKIVPAKDVTYTAQFSVKSYTIKFIAGGSIIDVATLAYGAKITAPEAPAKEGYTFSGWKEVPETMPANDVTITGSYEINQYTVKFVVDGETISEVKQNYGTIVTAPATPSKEGYTFSGWIGLVQTVPAQDVTVNGSFSINSYKITYLLDGEQFKSETIKFGEKVTAPEVDKKEGYTFGGWKNVPATMPAEDVIVTGAYIVNKYMIRYYVGNSLFAEDEIEYGAKVILRSYVPEESRYTFKGWIGETFATMPAHDIEYHADIIDDVKIINADELVDVYSLNGHKLLNQVPRSALKNLKKGAYVVNGKVEAIK